MVRLDVRRLGCDPDISTSSNRDTEESSCKDPKFSEPLLQRNIADQNTIPTYIINK